MPEYSNWQRYSIKDADSVGSNPTSGINVYVFQMAEKLYSECSNVQVRVLSYTAPIAQQEEASDLSSEK